jgi:hypothetical protein
MFAASRERLLTGHLALQAPVLKSVGQNCGHRFDYVWPCVEINHWFGGPPPNLRTL